MLFTMIVPVMGLLIIQNIRVLLFVVQHLSNGNYKYCCDQTFDPFAKIKR
jgi:hypothetical protein